MKLTPATQPTIYFIGVTTSSSMIMSVFPKWAKFLGLHDAVIKGIDLKLHDDPARYRDVVNFIKHDPLSRGALVTTHKLDLFHAASNLFDEIDFYANLMGETSCLSKRDGKLVCHAKDPISSGLTIDGFLPKSHFNKTKADAFIIGAGGSAIAISWHLMTMLEEQDRPRNLFIADRDPVRLDHIREIHAKAKTTIAVSYHLVKSADENDAIIAKLAAGSLIVNATGLGKDAPGSPITDAALLPEQAIIWELNYRGDLVFLDQAKAQHAARHLQIEDGWIYFIHGWTQVIGEVFDVTIPTEGLVFDEISKIAAHGSGIRPQ
jgi:shikimate 5-dehydrogenase